ncbi:iron-containing alcohol dehydrogenase [Halomonas cupida]|uniref:iron-containing alcohol dehydrogenase n=1 Tax=Halomonas cupida TaxID=44933 RepID=UPI003A936C44
MADLINYLTKIQFGDHAIDELANELNQLGITTPLFITDKGLSATPVLESVVNAAQLSATAIIFNETPANPTEEAVDRALNHLKLQGCDGIVAVGGGSSIDLAKAVALMATHPAPLRQYAVIDGGSARIGEAVLPLIAVPTTAGTGSEVGRASLITMQDSRKLGFLSPHLIPTVAICDPVLTLGLPTYLTAATGMDAIAHCIETYLSPKVNPPAEAIAMDGLRRASRHLFDAVENGQNLEARREMMMAALEGAMAFQKGLGAVHSLSHALGGLHELGLHHGTLNALLMPTVLRFNESHCEKKYENIKEAMGLTPEVDLAAEFDRINIKLGMPRRLGELGVTESMLDQAAQWAYEDHSTATNPRPATKQDFFDMLMEVL